MRTKLAALCLLAAGCGSQASSSGPTVAPSNFKDVPAVTGPAPKLAWIDNGFVLTGLPAVAADGNKILLPVMLEDGGRGYPNLAVVVKDRSDAVIHQQVVLGLDDNAMDQPPPSEAAIADANQYIDRNHGEQNWQPMKLLEASRDEDSGEYTNVVAGDGVEITWAAPRLSVKAGNAVVFEREFAAWEAEKYSVGEAGECENPSYLGGAHLDAGRKVVVIEISYYGNDTCWEPDSQHHVVAWQ